MSSPCRACARGAASESRSARTNAMDFCICSPDRQLFLRRPWRLPPRDPFHDPVRGVLRGAAPRALAEPLQVRVLVTGLDVQADDRVAHPRDGLAPIGTARLLALLAAQALDKQARVLAAVDEGDAFLSPQRVAPVADAVQPALFLPRALPAGARRRVNPHPHP